MGACCSAGQGAPVMEPVPAAAPSPEEWPCAAGVSEHLRGEEARPPAAEAPQLLEVPGSFGATSSAPGRVSSSASRRPQRVSVTSECSVSFDLAVQRSSYHAPSELALTPPPLDLGDDSVLDGSESPASPGTSHDLGGSEPPSTRRRSLRNSRTDWSLPGELRFEGSDERPAVVIIGAGFGGMKAARELKDDFRVTVIDCKSYFQYGPGILRSFVDLEHFDTVVFPLRPILEGDMGCTFVWGEVSRIDARSQTVHFHRLEEFCGDEERRWRPDNVTSFPSRKSRITDVIEFDYCIIAAGCSYNKLKESRGASLWFPTVLSTHRGASAWSHVDERTLEGRRQHIAEEHEKLRAINREKGTALVVGGGFIGVEWSMEIKAVFEDVKVVIVNRPQEILVRWPKRAIRYAQAALDRTVGLECRFGTVYDPDDPEVLQKLGLDSEPSAVYACTGVQASVTFIPEECLTLPGELGELRHGHGWVRVNRQLQVVTRAADGALTPWCQDGEGHARVFSVGDCTFVSGLKPMPKQCYPAEEQGFIVSRIIQMTEASVRGEPERPLGCGPPRPLPDCHWPWGAGMVVLSLGRGDACFVFANNHEDGSGIVGLIGILAVLQKDVIELSKVNEEKHGIIGRMIWHYVHNTPVHLWGEGPLLGY